MSRLPLRVGRSRTGLGLFATRPIKKRTIFIEYKGPRITNAEADRLEARGSRYMYEINSRWTIDGKARSNIARYGNHSCRPNAESDILLGKRAEGRKGGKVVLRAIKDIEPGEEITYDYGKDYWNAFIKPIGCLCSSCINKRKRLRAEERLKRQRREKRKAAKLARDGITGASSPTTPSKAKSKTRAKTKAKRKAAARKNSGKSASKTTSKSKRTARR